MSFDAGAYGGEEADPHLGCIVREVVVSVGHYGRANGHVWEDGVHRIAARDGFLRAFGVPRLIKCGILVLQTATLKKFGDGLADAC